MGGPSFSCRYKPCSLWWKGLQQGGCRRCKVDFQKVPSRKKNKKRLKAWFRESKSKSLLPRGREEGFPVQDWVYSNLGWLNEVKNPFLMFIFCLDLKDLNVTGSYLWAGLLEGPRQVCSSPESVCDIYAGTGVSRTSFGTGGAKVQFVLLKWGLCLCEWSH